MTLNAFNQWTFLQIHIKVKWTIWYVTNRCNWKTNYLCKRTIHKIKRPMGQIAHLSHLDPAIAQLLWFFFLSNFIHFPRPIDPHPVPIGLNKAVEVLEDFPVFDLLAVGPKSKILGTASGQISNLLYPLFLPKMVYEIVFPQATNLWPRKQTVEFHHTISYDRNTAEYI